ncbi:MAG: hypothetical protein U0521_30245 [Anaerolineae bacterium]
MRRACVEFLSRLYIARLLDMPTRDIVRVQRKAVAVAATRVIDQDRAAPGVGRLAVELEIAQLDAILDWTDRCEIVLPDDSV